jgi:hypothetical protein
MSETGAPRAKARRPSELRRGHADAAVRPHGGLLQGVPFRTLRAGHHVAVLAPAASARLLRDSQNSEAGCEKHERYDRDPDFSHGSPPRLRGTWKPDPGSGRSSGGIVRFDPFDAPGDSHLKRPGTRGAGHVNSACPDACRADRPRSPRTLGSQPHGSVGEFESERSVGPSLRTWRSDDCPCTKGRSLLLSPGRYQRPVRVQRHARCRSCLRRQ